MQPAPTEATPRTPSATTAAPRAELHRPRDAAVWQIISQPRSTPAAARGALLLSLGTAALLWASFTPLDFGPLAWIALVPLLQLVRLEQPTRAMYRMVYLGGLAFWIASLQWLRLGHPFMYGAWIALSVYLACYLPLFVGLCRVALWRLKVPLAIAAPVVWVGLELIRGHLLTGFSWYCLGHTQYRWIALIQISDVVGAYGVSFVVAAIAAIAAELIPPQWLNWARLAARQESKLPLFEAASRPLWRVAAGLLLLGTTLGYGMLRRSQAEFTAGPHVALIQGNVASSVKHDPRDYQLIQQRHVNLTGLAVLKQPDLIVWPETMFRWPLFDTPPGVSDTLIQRGNPNLDVEGLRRIPAVPELLRISQMARAGLVIGLETVAADTTTFKTYNSAAYFSPEQGLVGRYDKIHRVIFGEYIPLVEQFPFLRRLTPYPEGWGLAAGKSVAIFDCKGARFSPLICFEDTVPHLVRRMVAATIAETPRGQRPVDFLVNLTNDGWFHGSSELDQHLITAAFRAVECRTPVVRAVNTGISAFIDGDGVIRQRAIDPETGKSKQVEAILSDFIPLENRTSLYLRGGDWFAVTCAGICLFLAGTGLYARWRRMPVTVG